MATTRIEAWKLAFKAKLKFPEECPVLREFKDQVPSCYVNPVEKCPHFYGCLQFLAERGG